MLNALKMVVCLNSAVPFDMYSQQFTLCYCLVKSLQKPSSLYSLLKFVYVTSQLSHSLVMQPLLRKILDPPLHLSVACLFMQDFEHFSEQSNSVVSKIPQLFLNEMFTLISIPPICPLPKS